MAVSPRRWASSGAARASPVSVPRISARPPTPTVAQATTVKTIAAVPTSSPPRMKSTFCTVRVEASGRTGAGAGGAAGPEAATAAGAPGAPAAGTRADAAAARTCSASTSRRRRSCHSAASRLRYACRARSTRPPSAAISAPSRITSAAVGSGARPQPGHPVARSAPAPQTGQGYAFARAVTVP
ncbi:hypothetical protein [Plantactinospora sp. KLBMP9567]|uniref:hypothetical protein n=1 Tax=Plantactinospora sp. KLBMP9567 TaxID=3085900 RepID=UPI002982526C|nr:hypothetical protein [Plantactinospora sp. KLBMP9567]MDW5330486.1 hypothetical protein [Plantactinospora sp. KLBMP9567]